MLQLWLNCKNYTEVIKNTLVEKAKMSLLTEPLLVRMELNPPAVLGLSSRMQDWPGGEGELSGEDDRDELQL